AITQVADQQSLLLEQINRLVKDLKQFKEDTNLYSLTEYTDRLIQCRRRALKVVTRLEAIGTKVVNLKDRAVALEAKEQAALTSRVGELTQHADAQAAVSPNRYEPQLAELRGIVQTTEEELRRQNIPTEAME
ncbi:snapin/Pallidin/Snn1, partial [Kipferlia bialata]